MPKLTRITNKIFGQNATAIGDNPQIGQFGSAKAGTYIGTTDIETIQELSAWSNGWVDAVTPQNQFPALPEMTAVHKVLSRQTAYLYQEGIPEYDTDTTYFKGSLVKSYSEENGIKLYFSKIDENINHSLEDTTAWEEVPYATKQFATSASFPSNRKITLTLGASGAEYTAPANGWFHCWISLQSNGAYLSQNFQMTNITAGFDFKSEMHTNTNLNYSRGLAYPMPVKKGDIVRITFENKTAGGLSFIYAQGEQ